MQLKKRIKPNVCDAMRCKEAPVAVVGSAKYCAKHHGMAEPQITEATPQITDVGAESAPTEEVIAELVTPIKHETDEAIAQLQRVEITSQPMLDTVSQILRKVKADMKGLEAKRKSVTKPMLDAKKQIDAWFKPAMDSLKEFESLIKNAIGVYLARQEQEKLAALASGDTSALSRPAVEIPEGIQTRASWKYSIDNEQLLPRDYMCPDHAQIARVVAEFKDKTHIPGVSVYLDTTIAAGAAK